MQGLRSAAASGDLLTRPPLLSSQAVCAIFEKSVKTLLDDFAPMVPQLCEMLGRMYSTIPQASALDLTRQVGLHPRQRSDPGIGRVGGVGWMVALAGVLACIPGCERERENSNKYDVMTSWEKAQNTHLQLRASPGQNIIQTRCIRGLSSRSFYLDFHSPQFALF